MKEQQEAAKLLPCPFCGMIPNLERDGEHLVAFHAIETCVLSNMAITVNAWNTRQHSRLPANGWREINGVGDLPKEDGSYLWRYVGVKGYESFKVQYFTPRHSAEWFASMYSHWHTIEFTPPPTEKEEK